MLSFSLEAYGIFEDDSFFETIASCGVSISETFSAIFFSFLYYHEKLSYNMMSFLELVLYLLDLLVFLL
jgi:hypothetical protein